jgi:hypothetical protein
MITSVHHRRQLASYLTWMGVEDVERLAVPATGRER